MTRLSVNINKVATLRNARGGHNPDVVRVAQDCERFGAEGITVHPRPDERHIRHQDVLDLSKVLTVEFNVEGNPDRRFMDLVLAVKPAQATLVPDPPDALTSNRGWDTWQFRDFLKETVAELKRHGIRTAIFVDPDERMVEGAAEAGVDCVELYTEAYAHHYAVDPARALAPYLRAAQQAATLGLGLNAGHDLDLQNLRYFQQHIPGLQEVSIGHALICDALYFGLENTIQLYLRETKATQAQ